MAAMGFKFWFFAMLLFPVVGCVLTIVFSHTALSVLPDNSTTKTVIESTRSLCVALFGGMALLGLMNCLLHAAGFRPNGLAKNTLATRWMKRSTGPRRKPGMQLQSVGSAFSLLQRCGVHGMSATTCCVHLVVGASLCSLLDYYLRQ